MKSLQFSSPEEALLDINVPSVSISLKNLNFNTGEIIAFRYNLLIHMFYTL